MDQENKVSKIFIISLRLVSRAANNYWRGPGHVDWSNMSLLRHDPFLAGQILTVVTLVIVNPDCTGILL